jgi:ParB family chromosome partitioning protein
VSSSRRGLPEFRKMRHDRHFVEELANQSITGIGIMIPVDRIEANREQPRSSLGDLSELAASIRARGILEPLLVRPIPDSKQFQLIAGERRFHAALEVGLTEVPCVEMGLSDQEALEVALVENLQRKDLSPFEEAEGYRTLASKYGYTHDQVAAAVGKSRTSITETLRLLDLPPAIRDLCRHADITAKSMLLLVARAGSIQNMERLVQEIADENLDREGARFTAKQQPAAADQAPDDSAEAARRHEPGSFRAVRIRHQTSPAAPARISLTIRQPGVSRAEIIDIVQSLLDRLRSGELDEEIEKASRPES